MRRGSDCFSALLFQFSCISQQVVYRNGLFSIFETCFVDLETSFYILIFRFCILNMFIRPSLWTVMFKTSVSLLIFHFLCASVSTKCRLKSPSMIVDLSNSSCHFVVFTLSDAVLLAEHNFQYLYFTGEFFPLIITSWSLLSLIMLCHLKSCFICCYSLIHQPSFVSHSPGISSSIPLPTKLLFRCTSNK